MASGERVRRGSAGFSYVGLLILIVLMGLALATAGEVTATSAQRERETQLLWVGHAYRAAIAHYWNHKRVYPHTLEELLGDAVDSPALVRYIRRLYPDPMTNALDWVLVLSPNGGIMGVASSSRREPLKTANFDEADLDFEEASTYGDWHFTFTPGALRRKAK
jgi:type II secretory pathway pseudopilin PulG